jgi:hypothetical protein
MKAFALRLKEEMLFILTTTISAWLVQYYLPEL